MLPVPRDWHVYRAVIRILHATGEAEAMSGTPSSGRQARSSGATR